MTGMRGKGLKEKEAWTVNTKSKLNYLPTIPQLWSQLSRSYFIPLGVMILQTMKHITYNKCLKWSFYRQGEEEEILCIVNYIWNIN